MQEESLVTASTRPNQLDWHLMTFKDILHQLDAEKNNTAIGGKFALQIHGLIMERQPDDLDIIVFKPTAQQKEYIKTIAQFQIRNEFAPPDGYNQISYKFELKGRFLDIIISDIEIPESLLFYEYDYKFYRVNNVKNIIDAKRSYTLNGFEKLNFYSRKKDMLDLQDLKNNNFNL